MFLGAILASDPRFVSHSALARNPLLIPFLYGPTIVFAVITAIKLRNGQTWAAAAFAVGLMCTGLFHQFVAGETYGDPGYMAPIAHIAAPVVSLVAYVVSFLGGWIVMRATKKIRGPASQDGQVENNEGTQDS